MFSTWRELNQARWSLRTASSGWATWLIGTVRILRSQWARGQGASYNWRRESPGARGRGEIAAGDHQSRLERGEVHARRQFDRDTAGANRRGRGRRGARQWRRHSRGQAPDHHGAVRTSGKHICAFAWGRWAWTTDRQGARGAARRPFHNRERIRASYRRQGSSAPGARCGSGRPKLHHKGSSGGVRSAAKYGLWW